MTLSRRFFINVLLGSLAIGQMAGQPAGHRALLLISIDGMRPDYVTAADAHGLKIPNLRRILAQGAHASGVRGVLPTVTYPSHTTILTGVWPARHGIFSNLTFDPAGTNFEGWYWYSEDIHSPTLWEAAAKAGYRVGSVSWPVSVGAPGVTDLIPEYWRATTPDDLKLLRALSTPVAGVRGPTRPLCHRPGRRDSKRLVPHALCRGHHRPQTPADDDCASGRSR